MMIQKDVLQSTIANAIQAATQKLVVELGIDDLCNNLIEMPERIRRQQETILQAQQAVEEARQQVELARSVIIAEVNAETGENGKPKFSNEKLRDAEVVRRTATDPEFQAAKKALQEAEENLANLRFDLDRLFNEQSNLRAVLKARVAQVSAVFSS